MNSGIDEIMLLNQTEFRDVFEKWKKYHHEMTELMNNNDYQAELISYKSNFGI